MPKEEVTGPHSGIFKRAYIDRSGGAVEYEPLDKDSSVVNYNISLSKYKQLGSPEMIEVTETVRRVDPDDHE